MSDITWFGHSAFKISAPDAQVIIDPFFAPSARVSSSAAGDVDIVLVTHDHGDHVGDAVSLCRRTGAQLGAIVGTAGKLAEAGVPQEQILNGIGFNMGGTLTHKGVSMTMTQAYFIPAIQALRQAAHADARWPHCIPCRRYLYFQRHGAVGPALQYRRCPAARGGRVHYGCASGRLGLQAFALQGCCSHALGNVPGAGAERSRVQG